MMPAGDMHLPPNRSNSGPHRSADVGATNMKHQDIGLLELSGAMPSGLPTALRCGRKTAVEGPPWTCPQMPWFAQSSGGFHPAPGPSRWT
mmetsp:Transcript_63255/g.167652  ORF Transcript_63255/g.167652 Transcript_63255/m.167652 type:complete len:90 (-) Transcript_63255:725-994(-)